MKTAIPAFAILVLILFLKGSAPAQSQDNSLASQTRPLTNFNFITLKTSAEVYVRQDEHYNIEIEAPEELIDKITTEVTDNTLEINDKIKTIWKNRPEIKIYVSMPKPNGLEVSGSGDIIAQNNFTSDYLSMIVNGSGNIKAMEVSAQKLVVQVNGSGDISQKNSLAENALIEVSGSGGIYGENVLGKTISVSLSGSGEIRMMEVSSEKLFIVNSGSGNIRQSSGVAGTVMIENSGSGNVNAGDLNGSTVSAINEGSGDISVGTSETFEVQLTGSGDIHYRGTPKMIKKDVTGSGRVSSKED